SANASPRIRARGVCEVSHHLCEPGAAGAEEFAEGAASEVRRTAADAQTCLPGAAKNQHRLDETPPAPAHQPPPASAGARGLWRAPGSHYRWRSFHGAADAAILLRPGHPRGERLWTDRSRIRGHGQRSEALSRGHGREAAA